MQDNPNCQQLFKGMDGGMHMCMQRKGHKGPCKCTHAVVQQGTPLYKMTKQGHEASGIMGDADNPIK